MIRKMLLCIIILCVLVGCGHYTGRDLKPDDEFSESVKEKFGDSFHYNAHKETERYGSYYTFEIHDQSLETVRNFYEFAKHEKSKRSYFNGFSFEFFEKRQRMFKLYL